MKNERGVNLVELCIAMVIVSILAAIAIPNGLQMQRNAVYRQAARDIGAMLREARGRTVSLNREHRVQLTLAAGGYQYQLAQGNASSGSTVWATVGTAVSVNPAVVLTQVGCPVVAAPVYAVDFNPNGSAGAGCVVNVQDTSGTTRHTITVTQNTGRVRIQ
jgi:prepilin-type N-terminal cleavage/methylation domain-containing protein